MYAHKTNRGFIALISAIVVSFVLLITVVTLGMRGITGRLYLLEIENKRSSQALAESCVSVATVKVFSDPLYVATNVPVQVGTNSCTILSVAPNTPVSGQSTVRVSGIYKKATTYLTVVIQTSNGALISQAEKATAP